MACALDGGGELALILGLDAGDSPVEDFAALRDEAPEQDDVFVVDVLDLLGREGADLAPGEAASWPAPAGAIA